MFGLYKGRTFFECPGEEECPDEIKVRNS